jgi:hypothetical protein
MVDHTRAHRRIEPSPQGDRYPLKLGALFIPAHLKLRAEMPLWIHFHGNPAVVEEAAERLRRLPVITLQLGAGSHVYSQPFTDPAALDALLQEAATRAGVRFTSLTLSCWSAGYGAVRQILRSRHYDFVHRVLALDAIHAGYLNGQPGPLESSLVEDDLAIWVRFAQDALAHRKRLLITHSEVFPGTFASTTETADFLIRRLGATRWPVLRWGPVGMQQLSEVHRGGLSIHGFAGNSAPDHVDHLHGIADFMKALLKSRLAPAP